MKPLTIAYSPANAGAESDTLTVYIDGVGSSRMRPGDDIADLIKDHDSDLLVIELPADRRFSKKNVLRAIHCHPRYMGHRGLIRIVGLSMGALLGHDLIEYSKDRRRTNEFELVIIDAPTGLSDLQDQNAKYLKYVPLWLGFMVPAVTDQWLGKKLLNDGTSAPHEDGMTNEYLAMLAEHEAISKSIPIWGWLRHMKYLVNHKGPRSSVLTDVSMVIVESMNDPLVKQPKAHATWSKATDYTTERVYVNSPGHGLLLEFPGRYVEGLNEAFEILDLARLTAA
jgi:hypothetical protein